MGKGSRPAKVKNLVLVPGGPTALDEPPPALVLVVEPPVPEPAHGGATSAPVEPPVAIAEPAPAPPVAEPTLAELLELKERIRKEHPDWYPEFRDTFGHQFNEQLVGQLANLTAAELGLPEGTDPDRRRREIRALAFARSYLMAQAGDVDGLRTISPDLLYFWDDRLEGTLVPAPSIAPGDPAPWVHSINRLRSRDTSGLDTKFGEHSRFRRFVTAVKGWTNGRWSKLREASKRVLSGGEAKGALELQARELVEAIRAADREAPRLWRKERVSGVAGRMGVSPHLLLGHLQARIGDEVTQDLVSASSKPDVWMGDFVWEVEPGAQAIHAYPVSHYPSESEWITAGSFRILAVEAYGAAGVKVRVEQTAVFKEEK